MPRLVVALRAYSAVRLPQGAEIRVVVHTTLGPANVVIRTAYEQYGAGLLPRWLWVEFEGDGPALGDAREAFRDSAEAVGTMLAVTMNAAVQHMMPTVAFDVTPNGREHEYWQLVTRASTGFPRRARLLDVRSLQAVMEGIEGNPIRPDIDRALASYRESLNNAIPGRWLMAAAHAWMGIEALKKPFVELELQSRAVTRAQLAANWNVRTSQLDNEGRRRLLFAGRYALHDRCKGTSNDFEHAAVALQPLHDAAQNDASATITILRRRILQLIFNPRPVRRSLLARRLQRPFPCTDLQQHVRAVLIGDPAGLAPPDLQYPHFDVANVAGGVDFNSDGTYTITATPTVTARLGPGVGFRDLSGEIWGAPGTE